MARFAITAFCRALLDVSQGGSAGHSLEPRRLLEGETAPGQEP